MDREPGDGFTRGARREGVGGADRRPPTWDAETARSTGAVTMTGDARQSFLLARSSAATTSRYGPPVRLDRERSAVGGRQRGFSGRFAATCGRVLHGEPAVGRQRWFSGRFAATSGRVLHGEPAVGWLEVGLLCCILRGSESACSNPRPNRAGIVSESATNPAQNRRCSTNPAQMGGLAVGSPAALFAAELVPARHRSGRGRSRVVPPDGDGDRRRPSGARVHRPGLRRALARVGKLAATTGDTIHLASPRPAPEVIAHELTHVAHPSPVPRFFDDDDRGPEERQAEQVAAIMRRAPILPRTRRRPPRAAEPSGTISAARPRRVDLRVEQRHGSSGSSAATARVGPRRTDRPAADLPTQPVTPPAGHHPTAPAQHAAAAADRRRPGDRRRRPVRPTPRAPRGPHHRRARTPRRPLPRRLLNP